MTGINIDGEGNVSYHDSQGNEIFPKCCKCGGPTDTCLIAQTEDFWYCNKCLFVPVDVGELSSEFGSMFPIRFLTREKDE